MRRSHHPAPAGLLAAGLLSAGLLLATPAGPAAAQGPARADSGARGAAELPLRPTRTVRFTTDEGTWLSLDVSPDGRTLVFDMTGDLYTLPMAGGRATRITSGMAFDTQPRWSPDGRSIVFVSDRDGSDDVWLVDADGGNARQVSRTDRTQFVSPEWTPDGRYVVVSRNAALFATNYSLYLYHRDGGTGVRMTGAAPAGGAGGGPPTPAGGAAQQRNYVGAAFGREGRYVYAASRMGGAAGYNQTGFDWQVVVYDRETGETSARAAGVGGAFRPTLSPDGRWLVYGTRQDSVTSLRVRDAETGDERWLVRDAQRDDMESRFTRDLLPGMAFTPDSRTLVAAWGGKIWRVDVQSGQAAQIPFTAEVDQQLGPLAKFEYAVNDSALTVAQIRGARPSPDGRRLVFTALGKLWLMELPNGAPRRLTRSPHEIGEHSPVWSPDGRHVAYVTWTEEGGDVHRVRVDGGTPERLTRQAAFYTDPNYTPNGQRLVVYRAPRQPRLQEEQEYGRELVWLPAAGGALTVVAPVGNAGFPHFTRDDNERIYLTEGSAGLVSMRFDGTDRKQHVRVTGNPDYRQPTPQPAPASEILISPAGDRALARVSNNVFVVDIPQVGPQAPTVSVVSPTTAAVPVRRLTRIGGEFVGWHADGARAHYSIGRSYFTYDLARADSLVRDSTARADSLRRARGDTADRARPGTPASDTLPADTAREELVQWVEPDSVMAALLARTGYLVTRYQGQHVVFLPGSGEITLDGAPAAVLRGQALVVGDSIVYSDSLERIDVRAAEGRTVVLRDPAQGEDVIASAVTYNLATSSGVVREVCTAMESGETWYVCAQRAGLVGSQSDSVPERFYGHVGAITSCDLTEPHYHFEARNLKMVSGNIMVARPAILYIGRVPVMWLPFVFQDMRRGRRSGILSPRLGVAELVRNSPTYRRSVENVGYYFALSDYADAAVWLDWRSGARATDLDPGYLRYNGDLQYRWLDRFLSGRLGVGYEEWGDSRTNLQLSWSHQQQFSQRTSFTSSINYVQSTQLQRLGAINPQSALASIRSNATFQTRRGPFSLNLGGSQTQYTGQERVDRTFPSINLSSEPISLGDWLTWTPALSASNSQNLNNPVLGDLQGLPRRDPVTGIVTLDTAQFDRRNTSVNLSTPLKIFNFNWQNSISVTDVESTAPVRATIYHSSTPGDSSVRVFAREFRTEVDWTTSFGLPQLFGGTWNLTPSIGIQNVAPGGFIVRSFLSGGRYVQQSKRLTYNLSVSPTLYRRFPGFGPFEALRHSIAPQISYGYAPAAEVDPDFLRAVGQNPETYVGAFTQSAVSLNFSTVIEAKLRGERDSTAPGDAGQGAARSKLRLLSLDFSPLTYDFVRAREIGRGLTSDAFSLSGQSELLPGFQFGLQYSLYNGPSSDRRSEFRPYRTGINASFNIGRNSSALALLSRIFGRAVPTANPELDVVQPTGADSLASRFADMPVAGSRARIPVQTVPMGQGWQASITFTSQRTRPDLLGTVVDYDPAFQCEAFREDPISYERCVDQATRNPPAPGAVPSQGGVIIRTPATTSITSNMTFDLTPRWATSWSTSYDFERGDFASHQVSLQRDLHDWRAIFAVTQAPNGNFAFSFFIALKAQPDLKFDFRRQSYRGGGAFPQ